MREVAGTFEKRTQFSIRNLFVITFVAACLFALFRWAGLAGASSIQLSLLPLTAVTLLPVFVVRAVLAVEFNPFGPIAISSVIYILVLPFMLLEFSTALRFATAFITHVGFMAAYLGMLRRYGYRLLPVATPWALEGDRQENETD